eukprot:TRINITY_DN11887_c0_g1_i1.p1 TRINITY_DN11887_c0_g1~~TRINITY_DN11887_c0_g1_i1.p1  ORF type:complete len:160 (-),score=30.05 TRINITY_DN11887_c0_g1_i1:39-518(-)
MAFNTWSEVAATLKEQVQLLGGALYRMIQCATSRAFNTWRELASLLAEQRTTLAFAMQRLQHRALSMAFIAWTEGAASHRERARLVGGALRRFVDRALSMAFNTWREAAALPRAVSYTHLTLPTKRIVYISVVAASFKNNKIEFSECASAVSASSDHNI